jgi:Predicted nucleotide-binding protein containing TIR-like domain
MRRANELEKKMYNLLMFGHDGYWDERTDAKLEYSRFLSYTHEAIKTRLLRLTDKAIAELICMPTLFAYEFTRDLPNDPSEDPAPARVGKLTAITRRQQEIEFQYVYDSVIAPIPMGRLRALASELDIDVGRNENYRSHWAVKDVDLFKVLQKEGLIAPAKPGNAVDEALKVLAAGVPKPSQEKPKIFLVHGRDDGLKNEVGRWLGKIGFNDVILHEQANGGRTLITKFQESLPTRSLLLCL